MEKRRWKRYNFVLPLDLFDQLQRAATEQHTSVAALLRRFVTLGMIVLQVENDPDRALIIRDGDQERTITFM